MSNIFNYIVTAQNQDFTTLPLNELDILILTELLYLPFEDCLTSNEAISLYALFKKYQKNQPKHHSNHPFLATENRYQLFKSIVNSKRYRHITLSYFYNKTDELLNMQFCAATFIIPSQGHLIVFRGTDDSLIGWQEDFMLLYDAILPAQKQAQYYTQKILSLLPNTHYPVFLSGHSKGGNLATYAALNLSENDLEKIKGIYQFDSPGFSKELTISHKMMKLKPIIHRFIPEDSIVGMMLSHTCTPTIVKSDAISVFQHDIFNWHITDTHFDTTPSLTHSSQIIDITLKRWTLMHSNEELEFFSNMTFKLLTDSGITTLKGVSTHTINQISSFFEQLHSQDKEVYIRYKTIFQNFITVWKDTLLHMTKNKLKSKFSSSRLTSTNASNSIPSFWEWLNQSRY